MNKKPKKYGLKVIMVCDSSNSYMLNGLIDMGIHRPEKLVPGKIAEHYTLELCEPYLDSNRNITLDNWFTSMPLAEKLLKRRTTLIGTLRRKGYVPNAMIDTKLSRPVESSIFLFRPNMTLLSYKPKQNKVVLLLSSKHSTPVIGEKNKPEIIHDYNNTKGGVDVMGNMCSRYSCSRKTQRWPLCLFYGLLNIATVNTFLLFRMKDGSQKVRRTFMHTLARELVRPWAKVRIQQRGMKQSVICAVQLGLGIVLEATTKPSWTM